MFEIRISIFDFTKFVYLKIPKHLYGYWTFTEPTV